MSLPILSIVIPVYKVEKYLEQCVLSVLSQTLANIEILLIDDGSPDTCPALCDAFAQNDSRVRVIHQKNQGLAGARNTGLYAARGEYVAFLDSDDFISHDAYEKMYALASQHDADIVFCQAKYFDENLGQLVEAQDSSALPLFQNLTTSYFTWQDIGADKIFSYDSFVVAWNKICKRSFLLECKADFPVGLIYEDNPFYFQTIFAASRMCVVRERLVTYRINRTDSIIQNVANGQDARAMHILGIMADIERRLSIVAPSNAMPAFYRYAASEIRFKYDLIPWQLQKKYCMLAKGLLPITLYMKLRMNLWLKKVKQTFSICPLRLVKSERARALTLFGCIPIIAGVKHTEVKDEFDAIITFYHGQQDSFSKTGNQNALVNCKKYTLDTMWFNLADVVSEFSAKNSFFELRNYSDAEENISITQEMRSICALFSISKSILILDNKSTTSTSLEIKSLFYRLNCIFLDKKIEFTVCADSPHSYCASLPQGLEYVAPSTSLAPFATLLRKRTLKQFTHSLSISFLGMPIIVARRK